MRASPFIAIGLVVVAAGWIGMAYLEDPDAPQNDGIIEEAVVTDPAKELTRVRIRDSIAQSRERVLLLTGRTEADRRVELKAETNGRVVSVRADKGDEVSRGTSLIRVAANDRNARLARAEAEVKQRELEFAAAEQLAAKKFRSETSVAEARANLEAAQADLTAIRVELGRTGLSAPFDGILEDRMVELGDYLQEGDPVAVLVDLDPMVVVASIPEREIGSVELGKIARTELVTGQTVDGIVSYIAPSANSATRTFQIEVEVANPDQVLKEGVTTTVVLPMGAQRAHFIPKSIIVIADDGRIGVRTVENGDTVRFREVAILGDEITGFWIAGLPDRVQLITTGQEWVKDGAKVITQPDPAPAPRPAAPMLSEAGTEAG